MSVFEVTDRTTKRRVERSEMFPALPRLTALVRRDDPARGEAEGAQGMVTTTSGYSGTPLPKKLGIKEGSRVALVSAPQGFETTLGALPPGAHLRPNVRGRLDVIVFFVTRRAELSRRFPVFMRALDDDGGLWVAWPKQTSGVATDLKFDA